MEHFITAAECIWLLNSGQLSLSLWLTFTKNYELKPRNGKQAYERAQKNNFRICCTVPLFSTAHFWGEHSHLNARSHLIDPWWRTASLHDEHTDTHLQKHSPGDPADLLGHCTAPHCCRNRTYHLLFKTDTHVRHKNHTLCMDINTITHHPMHSRPITRGLTNKHYCSHELDEVIWVRPVQWAMLRLHYEAIIAIIEADLYLKTKRPSWHAQFAGKDILLQGFCILSEVVVW